MKIHSYQPRHYFVFLITFFFNYSVQAEQCYHPNSWFIPKTQQYIDEKLSLQQISTNKLVMLGEHHANEKHHQWHSKIIAFLAGQDKQWQIGMEVFPRSKQHILNKWINKEIDEHTFIKELNWQETWSFPYDYYKPIFDLARENNIPLVALNVDRKLIQKTGKIGWKNVPKTEREGISNPTPPSKSYIRRLAVSFQRHNTQPIGDKQKQQFSRFVQQQLLWDRAMAEGITKALRNSPDRQMVAIIGSWHLIGREGVPFQLEALNVNDYFIAIPWDDHLLCDEVTDHFSDILYTP